MDSSLATDLRWVLLIAGTFIIAGVYFYTLWDDKRHHRRHMRRQEPGMRFSIDAAEAKGETGQTLTHHEEQQRATQDATGSKDATAATKIIALHIQVQPSHPVLGQQLLQWAESEDMVRRGDEKSGYFASKDASFYVADILQPGTFQWARIHTLQIHGLSFFARLPVVTLTAVQVFDSMRLCAVRFAERFNAVVLDSQHRPLTAETQRRLEQELLAYQDRYKQSNRTQS